MRIAIVNQHPADVVGGSELQCDLIARGLTERGHEVHYVAVAGRADGTRRSTRAPASTPYRVVGAPMEPRRLAAVVADLDAEVVYWRFNRRGLRETARALHRRGVPLVVALAHVDDVTRWPSWPWPMAGSTLRDRLSDVRSRVRWRWQRGAYRWVRAIASQREDLIGRVPVRTVGLQRYVPNMMPVGPSVEVEAPFVHPRPFVAWVANLKPRKRPHLLPGLADALAPHGIDLLVVGPVQDPRSAAVLQEASTRENLHLLGAVPPDEVPGILAAARCLAVTAMPEGFSNVMLQAWWHGTPTVSLDYDPDGLIGGHGFGAVAEGDVDRFHAEVVRLACDDATAGSAGERAHRFARERFAPEVVLDALELLLEEARR